MDKYIEAGKIINTHGVTGDIKIDVWLDSPEFLKKYKRIFLNGKEYKIVRSSVQKSFLIAHLDGIDCLDDAVALKNITISICRDDVKLPKGTYFICDIIGAKCVDEDENEIGILTDVIENPTQMIYVISGESEHLVPCVPEFVINVDIDNKILTFKLIEGM